MSTRGHDVGLRPHRGNGFVTINYGCLCRPSAGVQHYANGLELSSGAGVREGIVTISPAQPHDSRLPETRCARDIVLLGELCHWDMLH